MYIPVSVSDSEQLSEPNRDYDFSVILQSQSDPGRYYLGSRSTVNTTSGDDTSMNTPEAFIGVTAAGLILLVLIVAFALYKKCSSADDAHSDTASTITDSAWRIEDIEALSSSSEAIVAAKHRKRLKKLDQVAPIQSLHDWRAEKQLSHIETFATVSTKLICAICLELIEEKDKIRELQCGHVYHSACLNLWVERGHHDCPLCKYDILGLRPARPDVHEAETTNEDGSSRTEPSDGPRVVIISNAQPQEAVLRTSDAQSATAIARPNSDTAPDTGFG